MTPEQPIRSSDQTVFPIETIGEEPKGNRHERRFAAKQQRSQRPIRSRRS